MSAAPPEVEPILMQIADSWSDSWADTWAENEFADADLGDARRTRRLVELAATLGAQPHASLPEASEDPAQLKAAYRFFDNDDIRAEAILQSHVQATYARLHAAPLVLAVQDTTLLDWTHHPAKSGLGPLAKETQQGLLAHSTLAITPERVPLGLLAQQVWARDPGTYAQPTQRRKRSIDQKESQKWLTSLKAVIAAGAACPETHFISVGDREADVYDLFLVDRPAGVDLLVRAAWDRRVEHPERYLWKAMATAAVAAEMTLLLPRQKERPARTARLQVRWQEITLRAPRHRASEHLPPVRVFAVWAVEIGAPADAEAVEWLLLCTHPIATPEQALERLQWYACRWGIEVWHKILKSGCRIESKQLETGARLERCLCLYSVIAWRIQWATMLSRVVPDAPCTLLLEEHEWQALYCKVHRRPTPPATPPSLKTAVAWIAALGGFLGRKSDGEPGVSVLWKGFQHLVDLAEMYRIMRPQPPPPNVGKG